MTNKFDSAEDFFNVHGESVVRLNNYEMTQSVTVEELFQHFLERMLNTPLSELPGAVRGTLGGAARLS